MNIKIVCHPFNKFVPLDCKSLFLDVKTTEDKLNDIMKEVYSEEMELLSMTMYANIKERDKEKEEYLLDPENKKINEKFLRSVRYRNQTMYEEMLTYRKGLTKDTMKLVADKWLQRKEKEIKKRTSSIREWKVLAAEIVRKVDYEEDNFVEFSWKVYPIKNLILPQVKLLHKILSHVVVDAWLYIEGNIRLTLRTTHKRKDKKKFFVHLSCPKGELLEKCKTFITKFLQNYII